MTDDTAARKPTESGGCGTKHDASAEERRRFLESAAAVTVSAERIQQRAAARALRALGYRGEPVKCRGRRASVALLGKVLGDGVLLRPRGRSR